MDTRKAWMTLGVDPDSVFAKVAAAPKEQRAGVAAAMLEDARRRARGLMSVLHPDKPGGDHESFVLVQRALTVLTEDTETFMKRISASVPGNGWVVIKV